MRLILFCTCPPLCVGALWPMPAWVWHDVRSLHFFGSMHTSITTGQPGKDARRSPRCVGSVVGAATRAALARGVHVPQWWTCCNYKPLQLQMIMKGRGRVGGIWVCVFGSKACRPWLCKYLNVTTLCKYRCTT